VPSGIVVVVGPGGQVHLLLAESDNRREGEYRS